MALNNPAFNNPAFQDPKAVSTYPGGAQAATLGRGAQTASAQHATVDAAANAQLEGAFAAPAAGAVDTDRMTVEDTVMKTVGLFAILLVTAVVGWVWTLGGALSAQDAQTVNVVPWILGALGGFVLSMVVIFTSRKKIRPALIFAYAAFEGLFIGGISAFFEMRWEGIVLQATLATVAVVGVTLALFASGKIRASKKATKIFMIAMFGYLVVLAPEPGAHVDGRRPGRLRPQQPAQPPVRHPVGSAHRRARRHHGRLLARARLRLDPAGRAQPRSRASSPGSAPSASWSRSSGSTSRSCASSRSRAATTSRCSPHEGVVRPGGPFVVSRASPHGCRGVRNRR